jgi:N-acetylmuramoyl-L-alanine amidase
MSNNLDQYNFLAWFHVFNKFTGINKLCLFNNGIYWIILFFLCGSLFSSLQAEPGFQVNLGDGKSVPLPVKYQDGFHFVALQDFANCLGSRTFYSEKAKKAILYFGSSEIKIGALNPFVVIDDKVYQMPIETRYLDAEIFLPLKYFAQLLAAIPAFNFQFDEAQQQINLNWGGTGGSNIARIEVEPKSNGILVKIICTQKFQPADLTARVRNDWVYFDIYKGVLNPDLLKEIPFSGQIEKIIPLQLSETLAQISIKVNQPVITTHIISQPNSQNILLSIQTEEKLSENVLRKLENDRKKWLIDKIVIDPGHGGIDPGAVGPTGLYEKDVVLKIAKFLKEMLAAEPGIQVFMTREDDRLIPLKGRTAMANRVGAKLFISIHANSVKDRRVQGSSTYILGPAKTEEAIEVARFENSAIRLEESQESYPNFDDEQFILSSIAQSEFTRESEELAALVQKSVTDKTDLRDRGVIQAGYYVLIGASMPNILFEAAFISNRAEEKKLKSANFQKKLAEALFESIKKFKEKYEQNPGVSGQY